MPVNQPGIFYYHILSPDFFSFIEIGINP